MKKDTNKTVGKTTTITEGAMLKDWRRQFNLKQQGLAHINEQTAKKVKEGKIQEKDAKEYQVAFIKEEVYAKWIKSLSDKQRHTLAQIAMLTADYEKLFKAFARKEQQLDNIYGKDRQHIMELTDEERQLIEQRRNKQIEIKQTKVKIPRDAKPKAKQTKAKAKAKKGGEIICIK